MPKNPREPKAVKRLLAAAQRRQAKRKPQKPPANGTPVIIPSSLWDRIRLRRPGSGGR